MLPEKKRRLSLTKRQLEEKTGADLLDLLGRIAADGVLSDAEVTELTNWLQKNQSENLPAVGYLADVIKDIVADGKITDSERVDLFLGIEKVLPVTERRNARTAREEAEEQREHDEPSRISRDDLRRMSETTKLPRSASKATWRTDPITDAQMAFIRSMGGSINTSATKGEASDLIESLLQGKPLSSRQQMVMRFWARERQPGEGAREISEWTDQFYQEDGDRKLAWELFKNESEDNGLQGDPNRVPLGVGPQYLARIKAGGESATPKFRNNTATFSPPASAPSPQLPKESQATHVVFVGVAAVLVVLGAILLSRRPEEAPKSPQALTQQQPPAKTVSTNVNSSKQAAPSTDGKSENQNLVRQLRIAGFIGGARQRVSIEGRLLGSGDIIDEKRGILIYSINAETETVTFIDMAGETYSRSLK